MNASSAPRTIPANSKLATRRNVRTSFFDQIVPAVAAFGVAIKEGFSDFAGGAARRLGNFTQAIKMVTRRGKVLHYTRVFRHVPSTLRRLCNVSFTFGL